MPPGAQVVIIGGGFAGLAAARGLAGAAVDVTLVDRKNHHVFQPLLYQVATAGLSPAEIASPIRHILRRQQNTRVLLGDVTAVDPRTRCVRLDTSELAYDFLILAAGVTHSYFGHDAWQPHAPGLKTIEDALEIRRRVLIGFEQAERCEDAELRRQWLTFAVIGGGPTGVEMAGAFAEIARHSLARDFRPHRPARGPHRADRGRAAHPVGLPGGAFPQGAGATRGARPTPTACRRCTTRRCECTTPSSRGARRCSATPISTATCISRARRSVAGSSR